MQRGLMPTGSAASTAPYSGNRDGRRKPFLFVKGERVKLSDIKWDASIYPRSKWSTATVDRYADAMLAGDTFPALIVEAGTNRLLDGKHRMLAYEKIGIEEAPTSAVVVPEGIPVKLYALSLSAKHGDRASNADTKDVIRETWSALDEEKAPGKMVSKLLGLSEGTVSGYVSDLLAKRREERRAKALRLSLLGWTQAEIAERLGCSQQSVSSDTKNFDSELFGSGHTDEEIALRLGLPVQIVKAIQLREKSDAERMKALDIKVQPYDVWNFQGCHDLMGDKHPGRIPGEIVCHALWYWTKPGDLVVDPMAGSGTTLDACLLMGRKCRGYDIDLHHNRVDVEQHDLTTGWPETVSKAALVFWDPPYFDKMDGGYVEGSISALDPEAYMDWFKLRFEELASAVKKDARLAFLMSDWDPENAKRHANHSGIFLWDYVRMLQETGWTVRRQIQVPLPTQQVHPDIVTKFRESRRMARLGRWLLECEK